MSAVRVDISAEQPEPIVQWSSSKMKSMPRNWNKDVKEKSVISTLPLSKITETCGSMVNLTLSRMAKKNRPIKIVTVPFVLEDVAPMLDGSAVPVMSTAPPVKNTARKLTLQKNQFPWPPPRESSNKIAKELFAPEDVAPTLDGFAAQEMNTVPLVKNTARKPTLPRN